MKTIIKKFTKKSSIKPNLLTKSDINALSQKIDKNQKALGQLGDVGRILRENEQNLKDLGGLKNKLDTLDKIFVTVDKLAGEVTTYRGQQELNSNTLSKHNDRIEKIEKHLNFPATI